MEKKSNLGISYQSLIATMVSAVREHAKKIPIFARSHNGTIRIGLRPLCQNAESWLGGGLSALTDDVDAIDTCMREFTFPIFPGGSHVIEWGDPQDGHTEPVNTYSYSAMKVAGLMWRREHGPEREPAPEGAEQYLTDENGWSMHKGVLDSMVRLNGQEYLWLYVCVSGANSDDDRRCAFKGIRAARDLLTKHARGSLSWTITVP